MSECCEINVGLKQCCVCSPMFFSLFMYDIADVLEGGCNLLGLRIRILVYADGIVLIAPTANSRQRMTTNL